MVDPTAKLKIMLVFLLGKIPSDTIAAIVSSLISNDTTILQIVSYILHFIRITKDFFFFFFRKFQIGSNEYSSVCIAFINLPNVT